MAILLHKFDPSATAVSNLIANEIHTLSNATALIIVAQAGLFYSKSLIVQKIATGAIMHVGVDYEFQGMDVEVTAITGYQCVLAITFLDPAISGQVALTYQAVGGKEGETSSFINELKEAIQQRNTAQAEWEQVQNKPQTYPALPHTHNVITDLTGLAAMREVLANIQNALVSSRIPTLSGQVLSDRLDRLLAIIAGIRKDLNSYAGITVMGAAGATGPMGPTGAASTAVGPTGLSGTNSDSGVTGGTSNAITATYTQQISEANLKNGLTLLVRALYANTSTAPTFAAGITLPRTIVKGINNPLILKDILGAGFWMELQFDAVNNNWVLQNPATGLKVWAESGINSDITALTALGKSILNIGNTQLYKDTIGNLGLGVIPAAWYTAGTAIQILNTAIWSNNITSVFSANLLHGAGYVKTRILAGFTGSIVHNPNGAGGWEISVSDTGAAGVSPTMVTAITVARTGLTDFNQPPTFPTASPGTTSLVAANTAFITAALTTESDNRRTAIAAETAARVTAITTAIDMEATNRLNADTAEIASRNYAISVAIAAEVNTRSTADSAEINNRTTAITAAVGTETTNRVNADNGEITARNAAITSAINIEANTRYTADMGEITNRETAISTAITLEANTRYAADTAEITNRNNAITVAVTAEITNRNNAITAAVTAESTNRNNADNTEINNRNTAIVNAVAAEAVVRSTADNLKAPIESPTFTGIPTAPQAVNLDNTYQIATTNWVRSAMANIASSAGFLSSYTQANANSGSGYLTFPSWLGGFTMQWQLVIPATSPSSNTYSFPIAFKQYHFGSVCSYQDNVGDITAPVTYTKIGLTTFNIRNMTAGGNVVFVFSIGI